MSEPTKTVIALRGTSGVGKTGIVRAMQSGHYHLIDCSILKSAMKAGFTFIEVGELTELHAAGKPMWPLLRERLDFAPYAVVESCVTHRDLAAELPKDVRLINAYCVAPPWMVLARRRTRYIMDGRATPANVVNYWNYTRWQQSVPDVAELKARAKDPGKLVFVNTMDWPVADIAYQDALNMVARPWQRVKFPDPGPQYQQCLHISGVWFGSDEPHRRRFETQRLDAVLPERMDGMTVLDVGAMEGAFCFEALNRGASYCMALDILPEPLALLREVRTQQRQPIGTAVCDVNKQPIPRLNDLYVERSYDLALLLNILHRVNNPRYVLRNVLSVAHSAVIETTFDIGDEPVKRDDVQYPNTWRLPPLWVEKVARECGHEIESINIGPYAPAERLVIKTRRAQQQEAAGGVSSDE